MQVTISGKNENVFGKANTNQASGIKSAEIDETMFNMTFDQLDERTNRLKWIINSIKIRQIQQSLT